MPVATYKIDIMGRGSGRSAQKQSAYGSGTKVIKVQSVVGAASYRAGETLRDQQLGLSFDYSERDDVRHTGILAPDHAPAFVHDRQALWNAVDQREKHVNAQLARAIIIGLPRELTLEQNIALVQEHLQTEFVAKGMVADFAIHVSRASDGDMNPHAHVLLTMRGFNADGTWQKRKNREWNGYDVAKTHDKDGKYVSQEQRFTSADIWRDAWETLQNEHLEAAGSDAVVSLKSYRERGIDQDPTVHMGYAASELEKKGVRTAVGDKNRAISEENARRASQKQHTAEPSEKVPLGQTEKVATESRNTSNTDSQARERFAFFKSVYDKIGVRFASVRDRWKTSTPPKDAAQAPTEEKKKEISVERPKVYRPQSREEREAMRQLLPYMQAQQWESPKDKAHFIAKTMEVQQQLDIQQRRQAFDRIAGKHKGVQRHRAIHQDRTLAQERERVRERERQQQQQRRQAGRAGHGR